MSAEEFVDHYEVLEISPNASSATVERVFRYLAKKYHPDVSDQNDVVYFTKLVEAFEALRDPQRRAGYDARYEKQKQSNAELVETANNSSDDTVQRFELLSLFYAQRKRNFKQPGIGIGTVETLVKYPAEAVNFHLWYFREKSWIRREESGQFAITADGIDQVDSMNIAQASENLRLDHRPQRISAAG